MEKLEKDLETSTKLFPLLKDHLVECQDSLTVFMPNWDKSRVQLMHLGEKAIQLNNGKEDRFPQMMASVVLQIGSEGGCIGQTTDRCSRDEGSF